MYKVQNLHKRDELWLYKAVVCAGFPNTPTVYYHAAP